MYLGGSGSTAAAVTSGTSAEENDDITGIGGLTDDVLRGAAPITAPISMRFAT